MAFDIQDRVYLTNEANFGQVVFIREWLDRGRVGVSHDRFTGKIFGVEFHHMSKTAPKA